MKLIGESKLWCNIVVTWNVEKNNMELCQPANWKQQKKLLLWAPHLLHSEKLKKGCTQVWQKRLGEEGIKVLGDILGSNVGKYNPATHSTIVQECVCEASQ